MDATVEDLHVISLHDYEERKLEIAKQLVESAEYTGFFYVVGAYDGGDCQQSVILKPASTLLVGLGVCMLCRGVTLTPVL